MLGVQPPLPAIVLDPRRGTALTIRFDARQPIPSGAQFGTGWRNEVPHTLTPKRRSALRLFARNRSKPMAHAVTRQANFRLDQAAVVELRKALRGRLLEPSDAGHGGARSVWNALSTRQP